MNFFITPKRILYSLSAIFVIAVVFVFVNTDMVKAQITPLLNFAGKVTNTDGSELADNTYDFSFGLYSQPTGRGYLDQSLTSATRFSGTISAAVGATTSIAYTYIGGSATSSFRLGQYLYNASTSEEALIIDYDAASSTVTVATGSPLWNVGQAINNRPFVEGGVININLGSVSSLSGVDFNQTLYLEVSFNGEVMQPRKILTANAQAFQAEKVGDKTEAELAALADSETISGEWSFANIVDMASSSDSAILTITQDGTGNIMEAKLGTSTAFAVLSDGRVQIGDYYFPANRTGSSAGHVLKIDAAGQLYWDSDFAGVFDGSGIDFLWATSTDELMIYPVDTSYVIVVGNNATTTFSDYIFEVDGSSLFDRVSISGQEELRFYDSDNSNYTALRATSTLAGDYIFTLPNDYGTAGYALLADGGGGMYWGLQTGTVSGTGAANQIAIWTGANIMSSSSSLPVYLGGSGATNTADARANLDLDEIYDFAINTSAASGWMWVSDGSGRGEWRATSSLGLNTNKFSVFVGTTTQIFNGEIATTTLQGYQAANYQCNYEYTDSFFCRTYDIIASINEISISSWSGSAWIAEGPPGYTSNSNDCNGWVSSSTTMLGAFWSFDSDGGGAGWLTNCSGDKPVACCRMPG